LISVNLMTSASNLSSLTTSLTNSSNCLHSFVARA
jgi:hypothetical protein